MWRGTGRGGGKNDPPNGGRNDQRIREPKDSEAKRHRAIYQSEVESGPNEPFPSSHTT